MFDNLGYTILKPQKNHFWAGSGFLIHFKGRSKMKKTSNFLGYLGFVRKATASAITSVGTPAIDFC